MKNIKKKEVLYNAVSDLDADHVAGFIKYDNSLPEKTGTYHPVLRAMGAFAACLVIFGGMFAGLKYLEYRGGMVNPPETASTETAEDTVAETTTNTETGESVYVTEQDETKQTDDKSQLNFSVTSGKATIYPESYNLNSYTYDGYAWIISEGPGAAAAETVPLIVYDRNSGIGINYNGTLDIDKVEFKVSANDEFQHVAFDFMNEYFKEAGPGVYRFVVSFTVKGRLIDDKYEKTCYEYPFDVEVKTEEEDWDKLDTQQRVERALYEITHYGINYQRFRYLCGDEHADNENDSGYFLGDEPADNFTYGYFLDMYDTETDPVRKQLMFVYISTFLTDTWNDETLTVPYTAKYFPNFDKFKADNLPRFDASYNEECDKWIHEYYYSAFCKYAQNMTENEVKTKYAPSYKLIKKYGFDNFSDSAKTREQKAKRVISEFFNMALSVKYGIAVNDPTSNVYFRYSEEGRSSTYEPGDAVYTALLKYYSKNELDRSDSAPAVYEQREGIKTIDKWKEYFSSLTTKSIADDFVKENKYFFTTEDGRVLTCNSYYFFNTNNLRIPYYQEEFVELVSDGNGVRRTANVFVFDVDEEKYYTVELSNEGGNLKITGGTLVTEWLYRTLSPEECAIRDTIMDVEKLFQFMRYGLVYDFRYYDCDTAYSVEYGNNPSLPEGLEEKLDQVALREENGKKFYITDRVCRFSYGLDTYDHWIWYFSNILPKDFVKDYIKENQYLLTVGDNVYLLDMTDQVEARLMINYGSVRLTEEKDGVITVKATAGDGWRPEQEVTFELEKSDEGYRITGGTYLTDIIMAK